MSSKFLVFFLTAIMLFSYGMNSFSAVYNGEASYEIGDYTVVAFLESGTFEVPDGITTVQVLVIGGGGSGAGGSGSRGGGGGAGGYVYNTSVLVGSSVTVTVGLGGVAGSINTDDGHNGGNSVFASTTTITAAGGGRGGYSQVNKDGYAGGCGGGGIGYYAGNGGAGSQGSNGGGGSSNPKYGAGGGGGIGGVGGSATGSDNGGNGGAGTDYSTPFGTTYGVSGFFGGGGGGGYTGTAGSVSAGGGLGANAGRGSAGTANTGGGGGGGVTGGSGGSGIILVRYVTDDVGPGLPTVTIVEPVHQSTVIDTLKPNIVWEDYNSSYTYWIQLAEDSDFEFLVVNESNVDDDNFTVVDDLDNLTRYYARAATMDGDDYGDWSPTIYFDIDYTPPDLVGFTNPSQGAELNKLKATVQWTQVEGATSYEIKLCTDEELTACTTNTYASGAYAIYYLDNGEYWLTGRAYTTEWSDWTHEWGEPRAFSLNNIPEITLPEDSSFYGIAVVDFEWTAIEDATGYTLLIYDQTDWAELGEPTYIEYADTNSTSVTMVDGVWVAVIYSRDNFYNGSISDDILFEVLIEEIPFLYTVNSVNYFAGDTVTYGFTGLEPDQTYTFKINKLKMDGTVDSVLATKTVVGDGMGEGDFDWVVPAGADYPFSVTYYETGGLLFKHYATLYNNDLYTTASHRYGSEGALVIGDNYYLNTPNALMHNVYDFNACLYTTSDYAILYYVIPDPNEEVLIVSITNMDTGDSLLISTEDLYNYNMALGYAEKNYIILPLSGAPTAFMDDYYSGAFAWEYDDPFTFNWTNGAYDYAMLNSTPAVVAYGESVLLIGETSAAEWTMTSAGSGTVGTQITWTLRPDTEEIWDIYNQMYFLDRSSLSLKIGALPDYYTTYPALYASSFTVKYTVSNENGNDGGARWGVKPIQYTYLDDSSNTYQFLIVKDFTLTEAGDPVGGINDWLLDLGLDDDTKSIIALIAMIAATVLCAIVGIPLGAIVIIVLMLMGIFTFLGWLPVWIMIILGLALAILGYMKFTSGGNGGE